MNEERTTVEVQRYLDELAHLAGNAPAEPFIRALIARSVDRLDLLCGTMLLRSYPRLARPPMNLQVDELLSAVVERLLKALREVRPSNVRQFFALANRHVRWELNDLARRLDSEKAVQQFGDAVPSPSSSDSQLSPNTRRILEAVESLPEEEREVFDLMRIQNLTQSEVMEILGVSAPTVHRRLKRGLVLLTEKLRDLEPSFAPPKGE
jgi:RNA polymerase sigma-70 factor (ECF subfamily)